VDYCGSGQRDDLASRGRTGGNASDDFSGKQAKIEKGYAFLALASFMAGNVLLPFVHGSAVYYVVFISNFFSSQLSALINTLIFETKGIGSTYGGTAIGLALTITALGAFISPPLGNSLAKFGPGMPFIFWAAFAAAGLPLVFLLRKQEKASSLEKEAGSNA
jgi:hypothetical protein